MPVTANPAQSILSDTSGSIQNTSTNTAVIGKVKVLDIMLFLYECEYIVINAQTTLYDLQMRIT